VLTHRGRKSGRTYQTVLEVVRYNAATRECVVASGWGTQSDWYRNLKKSPALEIRIGRDHYVPQERFLSPDDVYAELRDYERRHPRAARLIGRYLGLPLDGSDAARQALAASLPMVSFTPR
jgi:deazaflavin-dependent oxidoreductase (nitroreductase family)